MAICLLCYPKIKMLVGFDIVWILQEFFLFLLRIISFSSLVSWVIQNILIIFLTCLLTEHPDPNSNWVICVTAKSDGESAWSTQSNNLLTSAVPHCREMAQPHLGDPKPTNSFLLFFSSLSATMVPVLSSGDRRYSPFPAEFAVQG